MMTEFVFTIPFKRKRKPFKKCEECEKKKFSTTHYDVFDNGLNSYVELYCCKKCLKEAKQRTLKMPKCVSCHDVIDGKHETLCEYCRECKKYLKEVRV